MLRLRLAPLALLLLAGCAIRSYPPEPPFRPAREVPADVRERFTFDVAGEPEVEPGWDEVDARVLLGRLDVVVGDDEEPTEVEFEYWRSKRADGPAPAIVITPILGGGEAIATTQCRALAEAGFHVALVDRVARVLSRSWSFARIETQFRRSVTARRAVVEWLAARPEVDGRRIGAFGISMGALISTVLTAVEPRIHSVVVALGGADVPGIIRVSSEHRLARYREHKAEEHGISEREVEARIEAVFESDPLAAAAYLDPRQVLQVTTRFDTVIPPPYQEALWEELGRPLRYDLPVGHFTGILYLPGLVRVAARWFHRRFAAVPPRPPAPPR